MAAVVVVAWFGAVAQLVAHHTGSVGVRGSSPLSSTHETLATQGFLRFPDYCTASNVIEMSVNTSDTAPDYRRNQALGKHVDHTNDVVRVGSSEH